MKAILYTSLCSYLLFVCASCTEDSTSPKIQKFTVTPVESHEILANPGMGWQTFHLTRKEDKNLPSWIPSTVCYSRWSWSEVEPQPGKLDTEFIDNAIKKHRNVARKPPSASRLVRPTSANPSTRNGSNRPAEKN